MGKIEVNVYPDSDSPKLFKNKFLEFLTKTHPLVIDAMYLTIAYFLISHFYVNHSQSVVFIVGLFLAGFLGEIILRTKNNEERYKIANQVNL